MSLFNQVDNVEVTERPAYMDRPGALVLEVDKGVSGYSQNPKHDGKPYIAIDFKIVRVDDGPYHLGETVRFWKPLQGKYNIEDAVRCVAALLNCRVADVDSTVMETRVFPDNVCALSGYKVRAAIEPNGKTDAKGKPYMHVRFSPYIPDQVTEDIEAPY